jgi:thimet oligopeptidase
MNRARAFGRGISLRQQIFYTVLALVLHENKPSALDVGSVVEELHGQYSPLVRLEGTHMETSFGHLEGYSSLYYTYLWSQVIALDLFAELQRSGMFDRDEARRYRLEILEPGGSRDAEDLVRSYLGRGYSFAAFQKWVGQGH